MERNKPLAEGYSLRQAGWQDAIRIQRLLNLHALIHRYLDWREPVQWLGSQPFLLLEEHGKLQAVLACPTDPPNIAWVRLFACSWEISPDFAWKYLHAEAVKHMTTGGVTARCFVLALEDWFDALLQQNRYQKYQEIIILQRDLDPQPIQYNSEGLIIRKIESADLPGIAKIDASSFEELWIYSIQTLELAIQKSEMAFIAELQDKPVGYLLSTVSGNTGHLARIAVMPNNTRHHIATSLIEKLFIELVNKGVIHITLNTQSNNHASLALYDKMGFRRTGETFGVYQVL